MWGDECFGVGGDDDAGVLFADVEGTDEVEVHEAFARTAFGVAVFEVPAGGFEGQAEGGGGGGGGGIVGSEVRVGGAGILGAEIVFLVADHVLYVLRMRVLAKDGKYRRELDE